MEPHLPNSVTKDTWVPLRALPHPDETIFLKHLPAAKPLLGSRCYQETLVWDVWANEMKG